jgi:hypothetical protein
MQKLIVGRMMDIRHSLLSHDLWFKHPSSCTIEVVKIIYKLYYFISQTLLQILELF